MLRVFYQTELPFPLQEVISQYFDLEHIEHVHPETAGRYELVEVDGTRVRYRQHWPGGGKTSLVDQVWFPPDRMEIRFIEGRYRGVELDTCFHSTGEGTRIEDEYRLPGLPDWNWVRGLVTPWVHRQIDRIWLEDLAVGLPRGGWSGVPGAQEQGVKISDPLKAGSVELGMIGDLPDGKMVLRKVGETGVLLLRKGSAVQALDARCPHAGGPLECGELSEGEVRCPWHGSRFRFGTGEPCGDKGGPSARVYSCVVRNGVVEVRL